MYFFSGKQPSRLRFILLFSVLFQQAFLSRLSQGCPVAFVSSPQKVSASSSVKGGNPWDDPKLKISPWNEKWPHTELRTLADTLMNVALAQVYSVAELRKWNESVRGSDSQWWIAPLPKKKSAEAESFYLILGQTLNRLSRQISSFADPRTYIAELIEESIGVQIKLKNRYKNGGKVQSLLEGVASSYSFHYWSKVNRGLIFATEIPGVRSSQSVFMPSGPPILDVFEDLHLRDTVPLKALGQANILHLQVSQDGKSLIVISSDPPRYSSLGIKIEEPIGLKVSLWSSRSLKISKLIERPVDSKLFSTHKLNIQVQEHDNRISLGVYDPYDNNQKEAVRSWVFDSKTLNEIAERPELALKPDYGFNPREVKHYAFNTDASLIAQAVEIPFDSNVNQRWQFNAVRLLERSNGDYHKIKEINLPNLDTKVWMRGKGGLGVFEAERRGMESVAFSSGGNFVLVSSYSGFVFVFDLNGKFIDCSYIQRPEVGEVVFGERAKLSLDEETGELLYLRDVEVYSKRIEL